MKKISVAAFAIGLTSLLGVSGPVMADSFGNNITIYDGTGYAGTNTGGEDGETEPGMVNSQVWDLEGFFLNGSTLSMVAGFDFKNGVSGYPTFSSGDIFIDVNGNFGSSQSGYVPAIGNNSVQSNFGYEFVFDLNFNDFSYDIVKLDSEDSTITAWYPANEEDNPGSNPWKYESDGTVIGNGYFTFLSGLTDSETGFTGDSHYALTGFDLAPIMSSLGISTSLNFTSHFTMGCGNDNLMGSGTAPVPEPATMLLFGTGLAGLATVGRKKMNRA